MKKGFILLSVLLSLQLCGCSGRAAESKDTVPPASETYSQELETTSAEQEAAKEPETSAKESQNENSDISAAQEDNSASDRNAENTGDTKSVANAESAGDTKGAANTESTGDTEKVENAESAGSPSQGTVSQPEETPASDDNSCYSAATDISRDEVESYAARIKQQFLDHDWSAISTEISYPVMIADMAFHSSTEFLDASGSFDGKLQESFFTALEKEDCVEMFCSGEGIMMGESGEIWISEVLDAELNSQGLKIVAINGMLTK